MAFKRNMTNLSVLDLDSSMNSTQGLLTFMTDASKQIKTYLDDDIKKKGCKKKKQRKSLFNQLSNINLRIPSIDMQLNQLYNSTPASPTPSLDSTGSSNEDESLEFTPCSLTANRKRKSNGQYNTTTTHSEKKQRNGEYNDNRLECNHSNIYNTKHNLTTTHQSNDARNISVNSYRCNDYIVPSPTPDFDDLVNCMLTDELTPPFDFYTAYSIN